MFNLNNLEMTYQASTCRVLVFFVFYCSYVYGFKLFYFIHQNTIYFFNWFNQCVPFPQPTIPTELTITGHALCGGVWCGWQSVLTLQTLTITNIELGVN